MDSQYLSIVDGALRRRWTLVPTEHVQSFEIRRTLLDRLNGVSQLVVYVGGGASFSVPDLATEDALRLEALFSKTLPSWSDELPPLRPLLSP